MTRNANVHPIIRDIVHAASAQVPERKPDDARYAAACAGVASAMSDTPAPIQRITDTRSPVMRQWDAAQALHKSDPLLAFAYLAEGIGDFRVAYGCGADAFAKLTEIRDAARRAVEAHTGRPFRNALYPEER